MEIKGEYQIIDIREYEPHPENVKLHPMVQKKLYSLVKKEIGYITPVVVNKKTKHILDGHMRITESIESREYNLPAVVLDVEEEEEKKILLLLDYVSKFNASNKKKMKNLAESVKWKNYDVELFLKNRLVIWESLGAKEFNFRPTPTMDYIAFYFRDPEKMEAARAIFKMAEKNVIEGNVFKAVIVDGDEFVDNY